MGDAFSLMMEAGNYFPAHIQPWLIWMQILLLALPWLFIVRRGAQALILAQVLNFAVAFAVFMLSGNEVNRLFGLGHIFWIAPMIVMATEARLPAGGTGLRGAYAASYRVYAALAALTILISLVFDIRDVLLYLGGDTGSVLEGVPADHALAR